MRKNFRSHIFLICRYEFSRNFNITCFAPPIKISINSYYRTSTYQKLITFNRVLRKQSEASSDKNKGEFRIRRQFLFSTIDQELFSEISIFFSEPCYIDLKSPETSRKNSLLSHTDFRFRSDVFPMASQRKILRNALNLELSTRCFKLQIK